MQFIENRTFDEIQIGETATLSRTLTREDIELFAVMSGDVNPAHLDDEYAESGMFHKIIAHGMWGGALISTVLGTKLPGPGTIYLGQTLRFRRPVTVGDTLTITVTVKEKDAEKHRLVMDCQCVNQNGEVVVFGSADVIAPTEKIRRRRVILPEVHLYDHGARYRQLIAATADLLPIRTAVVHPVDRDSLGGAVAAAHAALIVPVFVGPAARIRAVAEAEGIDIAAYELYDTAHSHAAGETAVAMARTGEVEALMAGSQRVEEFMRAVLARDSGLGTGRRMSHVFVVDVPTYPQPLLITDAAINIDPDLEEKRDIVQNAIDLAHVLGIEIPRVAILSAIETVRSRVRSSVEAAALCKMVERSQISGALVDGPMAFDTAVSEEAAAAQGVISPVAGKADILVVPDLEAGTLLVKQLENLAEAQSAGIILGARVPIVLTNRTANALSRTASCAIALLLTQRRLRGRLMPG
jgi:phosphotransacetylase/acyl dehydratase